MAEATGQAQIAVHRSKTRGVFDYGWLRTAHSFSFGEYRNPDRVHFGQLRVLNDDTVIGGAGFDTHPHDNMEIISIPLRGALEHRDSEGNHGVISAGDVQIMSAGSGILHSEFNHSAIEEVNFLQIWILPRIRDIDPRYQQLRFDPAERLDRWQCVVAPDQNEALWINQNAWISLARISPNGNLASTMHEGAEHAYLMVLEGDVNLHGSRLARRDAAAITGLAGFSLNSENGAELLLIESQWQRA